MRNAQSAPRRTSIGRERLRCQPLTQTLSLAESHQRQGHSPLLPYVTLLVTLPRRFGRVTRRRRRCHRFSESAAFAFARPCSTFLLRERTWTPTVKKNSGQRTKGKVCFLVSALVVDVLHVFICTIVEKSFADCRQASSCRKKQRRIAFRVSRLQVHLALQEGLDYSQFLQVRVRPVASKMQRSAALWLLTCSRGVQNGVWRAPRQRFRCMHRAR